MAQDAEGTITTCVIVLESATADKAILFAYGGLQRMKVSSSGQVMAHGPGIFSFKQLEPGEEYAAMSAKGVLSEVDNLKGVF